MLFWLDRPPFARWWDFESLRSQAGALVFLFKDFGFEALDVRGWFFHTMQALTRYLWSVRYELVTELTRRESRAFWPTKSLGSIDLQIKKVEKKHLRLNENFLKKLLEQIDSVLVGLYRLGQ